MERNLMKDLCVVVRRPSTLMVSRPRARLLHCINCKMAGSGAIPMATVFRTPMRRQIGLGSLWPVHILVKILQL